tara:strand:- start:47324 stop:47980 length:657 start_codon:yes stop_codon:yes gene_type:complete
MAIHIDRLILYAQILLILWPQYFGYNVRPYWILWDVGQGQWLTRVESQRCIHIDVGGESYPQAVQEVCRWQRHYHWISHWDLDHYRFLQKLRMRHHSRPMELNNITIFRNENGKSKNAKSKVLQWGSLLIPGDSLKKQEKIWRKKLQDRVERYILSHHGSITSNSEALLSSLQAGLRQCLVSARRSKYGHPHKTIQRRLKKFKCPLVGTQEWGHIYFR